jgi:DNA polymerase I-like protein with 3'-5' exonuclease and polymerase domains
MTRTAKPSLDQSYMFGAESDWQVPTELPDLSRETEVAIDTETCDASLSENNGPGFYKYTGHRFNPNPGYICGISVAWRDQSIYIPIYHDRKHYFSLETVKPWLKALAIQSHTNFVFHNFAYDWGWIEAVFDIPPPRNVDDTAAMASMINENLPSFSLDNLCKWQGIRGKDETLLKDHAGNRGIPYSKIKQFMHELGVEFVGPYAEQDAVSTLHLAAKLRPLLSEEGLNDAYQIERDLLPITLKMKQKGIRVDTIRAEHLSNEIKKRCTDECSNLSNAIKQRVSIKEIRSNKWMKEQFEFLGLDYPRTAPSESYAEGQASFDKIFMANHPHWFPRTAHKIKHQYDIADKFLEKFIIKYAHNGRVHPTINQFRNEGGGARSHRFSYSDPPLQQMPSRDDEWAPLVRSCFIPEEGEEWCSIDYRQQEYRLIVYAAEVLNAPGAKATADAYRNDPTVDFHDYVAKITRLQRRRAKDVNFAISYGAGVKKFALMTGMDEEEAAATMNQYNERLPFVRKTLERFSKLAAERGYIRLIDGARGHFNLWEPVYRDFAREYQFKKIDSKIDTLPCFEDEFLRRKNDSKHPWYGERQKRAYAHKAFNRMIQGSAARQIKKAMVDIYRVGYIALIQMHDEMGFSFANQESGIICAKIMEEAVPSITIPMLTDIKFGPNWGTLKKK